MGVSRQAVSKWEQGRGYPEIEKLLVLSKELNVSLDYLMLGEVESTENNKNLLNNIIVPTEKITIKSYDGKSILLGWYIDEEKIKKEIDEISQAINNGIPAYELKYAAKVKTKLLRVKLDTE